MYVRGEVGEDIYYQTMVRVITERFLVCPSRDAKYSIIKERE